MDAQTIRELEQRADEAEDRVKELNAVCVDLHGVVDSLDKRMRELIDHMNELTEAVNTNTDFRVEMESDLGELEVMFSPDMDAFRDKDKDH